MQALEPAGGFAEACKGADGPHSEDRGAERSEIPEGGPGPLKGAETGEIDGEAILHRLRDIGACSEDDDRAARYEQVPADSSREIAIADAETFLEREPEGPRAEEIRKALEAVRR